MWSLSPPFSSISKKGSSGVWVKIGLVLGSQSKVAYRLWCWYGQESSSGAGTKVQEQVANCFLCSEISYTELYFSVAPKWFGLTERDESVWPSSRQREHLSPQLIRQIRSHKDLQGINWKICNEFDARDKCKNTKKQQRNNRELHLEMVGGKVIYVRVYWLRSQVRTLDHRSYSLLKLKMGLPFFV